MRAGKVYFPGVIMLVLALTSCTKEVVPPEIKEEPVFFVQGMFNGENTIFKAGVDNYYVQPTANTFGDLSGYLPMYSSTFTDRKDSFSVILVGNKLLSPNDAPVKDYLENVLDRHSLEYAIYMFGGDVNINYKHDGKLYAPNLLDIPPGSYFNILHAEDYQPPGDDRRMKKVQVSFKIVLDNISDPTDKIIIENGRATLLFSYQD